jgi:hypothetical protein
LLNFLDADTNYQFETYGVSDHSNDKLTSITLSTVHTETYEKQNEPSTFACYDQYEEKRHDITDPRAAWCTLQKQSFASNISKR